MKINKVERRRKSKNALERGIKKGKRAMSAKKETGVKKIKLNDEQIKQINQKPIDEVLPIVMELDRWRQRSMASDIVLP